MNLSNIIQKNELKNVYLPITIGAILQALGQNLFIIPAGLLSGGTSGLSLIANYSLGISAGIAYFILNIPMVILAIRKLSLKFTIQSFYAVFVITIVQLLTVGLQGTLNIPDTMLNGIFGGVIRGIGCGLVYRVGASNLGSDVLGFLAKRKFNINLGTLNIFIDSCIMIFSSIMYGVPVALYTIISIYVTSTLADRIMLGYGEQKNVMIVTREYEKIRDAILRDVYRGVTLLDAQGGYSGQDLKVIFTVVNSRQIVQIKNIMKQYDDKAFMTITDSSEVKGQGFRSVG